MIYGVIGRWKPFHKGGELLLKNACKQADLVKIGLGSANRYDVRNPFTAEESRGMIESTLDSENYEFIEVPDFGHLPEYSDGQMWKEYVKENFGELDAFISGNRYVMDLLKDTYHVMHSSEIIPKEEWMRVKGTAVRIEMAHGDGYISMVPKEVTQYIRANRLDDRFRHEFGLETLALLGDETIFLEDLVSEKNNIGGRDEYRQL